MAAAIVIGGFGATAAAQTFTKDIAPIVFANCAVCHRPGGVGPFSVLTYPDIRPHAAQVAAATARRVMPPWKPDPSIDFIGARLLSDEQIALIQQWVKVGAPEGDPRDLPAPPAWNDGWQFGTPDLVVTLSAPYALRADGGDVFRTFVFPIPTDRVQFVRAIEFRPGNARSVHHANLAVDRTGSSRRLDMADPEPGYAGGMALDANYPAGYMLGWTPGQQPRPSPDGMPWRLEPRSDIVVQLHMQPTGKPETVQPSIGFFFTDHQGSSGTPIGLRLGSQTIDIAPGDARYEIRDRYVFPVDVELLAIQPHAHNLGREVEATATLPDGSTRLLMRIRDWDFRWQDVYRYRSPVRLPKGTAVDMRFTYDNSAANPRNPVRPPRRIVWGQNTTDEMGDLWLQVVPSHPGDAGTLTADIARKTRAEELAGSTKLMQADPGNPLRHDAVAVLYLMDDRPLEAITHFRESLRLNPDSAPTHNLIGLAYARLRNYVTARAEFQEAIRLDPTSAAAHNNLGTMLQAAGDVPGALAAFRRAIKLRPDDPEVRSNAGRLLLEAGAFAEAAEQFGNALETQPDSVAALLGLIWVRASAPAAPTRDPVAAMALVERALATERTAATLDAVAAAQAAGGQFDQAVATAREAIRAADAAGNQVQSAGIRARLQLYEQGRPFTFP